jgi:hypothetical protein
MCKKSRESVDYLLLHCEAASALVNTIFSLVGLAWVMPALCGVFEGKEIINVLKTVNR